MKNTENPNSCPSCGTAIPEDAPQGLCPQCVLGGAATQLATEADQSPNAGFPDQGEIAKAFPNLEILELVGQGGMGIVYKARQTQLDRVVALKVLPKNLGADPQFAERFSREGKLLAKLNHPNIVTVYDFGHVDDHYYLLMEYVDGVNLREAMQAGRFSPSDALEIVPKICEALQFAHEQGILHRDIKPENVLLDEKGRVKIADFGIAKLASDPNKQNPTLTSMGQTLGTPHYMAPEQIENPTDVDHRADIYSLGVVLYEMLTGELPIGRFDVPSTKIPVSPNIDQIVLRALEKDRERRQSSADKLKTEVEQADSSPSQKKTEPAQDQALESIPARHTTSWSIKSILASLFSAAACVFISLPIFIILAEDRSAPAPMFMVVLPGLILGIIGSILGWIGLSDIRHSQGRLLGLPLGVFGALALPVLALIALFLVVPAMIALTTVPKGQLSPFSWILLGGLALLLSIILIVMTFRWASGNRAWIPLTRTQKIIIAVVTVLGILVVFPLQPSQPDAASKGPVKTETSSARIALVQDRQVAFKVVTVALDREGANPQLIIGYETEEQGAKVRWNRRGRFANLPDGLMQGTRIQANQDGTYAPPHHTVGLDLPNHFEAARLEALVASIQSRWLDRDMPLFPGDTLRVVTIEQPNGEDVILEIACQSL